MENQIPASNIPSPLETLEGQQLTLPPNITPQQLEELKARAKEAAIRMTLGQNQAQVPAPSQIPPKVIYVRRNLTVAELLVVFLISFGIVIGVQAGWNLATNLIPRIEIKLK
jgi:hypothetical protein